MGCDVMPFWLEIIINIVFAWLASVGFGLIINVPHRALFLCGISGSAGWILYWLANRIGCLVCGNSRFSVCTH